MSDENPENDVVVLLPDAAIPSKTNTFAALRDFCIRNDYPLPTVELVQQGGTKEEPLFVVKCQVSSVQRFGSAETKVGAKEKAAESMLYIISHNYVPKWKLDSVLTVDGTKEDLEYERREMFRSYRELIGLKSNTYIPIQLQDRHKYFSSYKIELKEAAWKVLNSEEYKTPEGQVVDLFKSLKLKPKTTQTESNDSENPFLFIELDCDYDAVFAGQSPAIYKQILDYFRNML